MFTKAKYWRSYLACLPYWQSIWGYLYSFFSSPDLWVVYLAYSDNLFVLLFVLCCCTFECYFGPLWTIRQFTVNANIAEKTSTATVKAIEFFLDNKIMHSVKLQKGGWFHNSHFILHLSCRTEHKNGFDAISH